MRTMHRRQLLPGLLPLPRLLTTRQSNHRCRLVREPAAARTQHGITGIPGTPLGTRANTMQPLKLPEVVTLSVRDAVALAESWTCAGVEPYYRRAMELMAEGECNDFCRCHPFRSLTLPMRSSLVEILKSAKEVGQGSRALLDGLWGTERRTLLP